MVKEDFLADKRAQQAVILNIVIIGEAATKLLQNRTTLTSSNNTPICRGKT